MRVSDLGRRYQPLGVVDGDPEVLGVTYDSRNVRPGYLFVAIAGGTVDGHDYLDAAFERGAVAALVARPEANCAGSQLFLAKDTREALAWSAATFRDFPGRSLDVVGVTGTNGKTTTTHLIEAALLAAGRLAGVIGTLGVRYWAGGLKTTVDLGYTTPQAPELQEILATMVSAGVRGVAMEVSSHALDQHRASYVGFKVGVFTNLTRDHLDYHGTEEAYAAAKARLFQSLGPTDTAVLNFDDPHCDYMRHAACRSRIVTYGLERPADLTLREVEMGPEGSRGMLSVHDREHEFKIQLPGRFNLYNALAALGATNALDVPIATALGAIALVSGVPGRVERVSKPGHPFAVMVDYAHTPDGLAKVLETVRAITAGRIILVFGCGGDRDRTKRPMMGRIASELADLAIVTSDNPRNERAEDIIAEILAGATGRPLEVIAERADAIGWAIDQARDRDTVLIAGKGHEPYQIIKDRRIAFDDREVARQALRERAQRSSAEGAPAAQAAAAPHHSDEKLI